MGRTCRLIRPVRRGARGTGPPRCRPPRARRSPRPGSAARSSGTNTMAMAMAASLTSGTEQGGDGQGQDQRGEGEQGVHGPHDHASRRRPGRIRRSGRAGWRRRRRGPRSRRRPAGRSGAPQISRLRMSRPRSSVPEPVRRRGPGVDGVEVLGVRAGGARPAGRRWPRR